MHVVSLESNMVIIWEQLKGEKAKSNNYFTRRLLKLEVKADEEFLTSGNAIREPRALSGFGAAERPVITLLDLGRRGVLS